MSISIKLLGASQIVTGSCYMVHARETFTFLSRLWIVSRNKIGFDGRILFLP